MHLGKAVNRSEKNGWTEDNGEGWSIAMCEGREISKTVLTWLQMIIQHNNVQ
jgi:hypothetical protein